MKQRLTRIHIFLLGSALISMPFVSSVGKESGLLGTMERNFPIILFLEGFWFGLLNLFFQKKNVYFRITLALSSWLFYF